MDRFDQIVLGAGINGAWAAYHLAKRGQRTLLLEQFPMPHSRGSSHGQSRIIRKAYPDEYQMKMASDSYPLWRQLERESGEQLMVPAELLCFGPGNVKHVKDVIHTFKNSQSANYKLLENAADLRNAFPSLRVDQGYVGCVDNDAGVLMADKCLQATLNQTKQNGCTILDGFKIVSILPSTDGSTVTVVGKDSKNLEGGQRTFQASSLVICAGPWTNQILAPLGFAQPLEVTKIHVSYFKTKLDGFPPCSFIFEDYDGEHIYGLPELEYPGLVKICCHIGSKTKAESRDQVDARPTERILREFIIKHFPGVDPVASIVESCMYTMSPDEAQTLDRHPKFKNIVFGCGFSGMGFKMAPVTGEILADMAMDRKPNYPLGPMKANRFNSMAAKL